MIKTNEYGDLFTIMGNSATFSIRDLPAKKGTLVCCFSGYTEVKKEYQLDGQREAIVKLTREDIENIGVGEHMYYIDLITNDGNDVDTLVYQRFVVYEKE